MASDCTNSSSSSKRDLFATLASEDGEPGGGPPTSDMVEKYEEYVWIGGCCHTNARVDLAPSSWFPTYSHVSAISFLHFCPRLGLAYHLRPISGQPKDLSAVNNSNLKCLVSSNSLLQASTPPMLASVLSSGSHGATLSMRPSLTRVPSPATRAATGYFYLPVEEEVDKDLTIISTSKYLPWVVPPTPIAPCSSTPPIPKPVTSTPPCTPEQRAVVNDVLLQNDLYKILGVTRSAKPDTLALRKAYFARCKACHPEYVIY